MFNAQAESNCVVNLITEVNLPMDVYLNGVITQKGRQCLVTVVDITEHMMLIDLKKKADKLEIYTQVLKDRESKMMELKKEVNDLLKRLGEEKKYAID